MSLDLARVGGGLDADARYTRRHRRLHERRLPSGLRSDIARLQRDDLASQVLDGLFALVHEVAEREGLLRTYPVALGSGAYVPSVHERRILRRLEADRAFRGRIRREVREHLRTAHVTRTAPPALVPDFLGKVPKSSGDILLLRSSVGLEAGTFLDAEPEELNVLVHDRIVQDWRDRQVLPDIGLDETNNVKVLVLGSGGGGFAKAAASRAERFPRLIVHESDPLVADRTDLPCVVVGSAWATAPYAVVILRAPAVGGAANHGCIYGERASDLSKLGPARWTERTTRLLGSVGGIVTEGALVFVVAPTSVRTNIGYEPAPALLDAAFVGLEHGRLRVVEQHRIIEVAPKLRPFVGKARPEQWLLVARKCSEVSS